VIDSIVAEHSILFLGSGFSVEAKNAAGKAPPTGRGLAREIAKSAGIKEDGYSLADLAEYCAEADIRKFTNLIHNLFRIKEVSRNQVDILDAPWLRLYTTNFDDAAEVALQKISRKFRSFTFQESRPRRLDSGTIVHLHGVVRDVDEENVIEKVVLGESAYVRQFLEQSPWFDQFLHDLRFCDACYFVGYSLADQHIAALLTRDPRLKDRIHFIEPDRIPDRIFASRVQKYGEIEPIGLDGFADLVLKRVSPPPISDFHTLKSFRIMETSADKKTVQKPTVNEVRDFLVHGKVNLSRLLGSLPLPTYAIPRSSQAARAVEVLEKNRSLIVDGRLGNGKSIFQHLVFAGLAPMGYICLSVRSIDAIPQAEIDFLSKQKRLVIFFDTFALAQMYLDPLSQSLPEAKFVVEIRTSLLEVRLFEIEAKVPRPYGRVSLNRLDDDDGHDFIELCQNAGVVLNSNAVRDGTELRDLLITVFQSATIRDKIKSDLERCFVDRNTKRIVIVVFLMQLVQADVDPDFLRLVTGVDPFSTLNVNVEGAEEIFSLREGDVALRSSVFAEFAMQQFVDTDDLSDAIHDCAVFCANRKEQPRYRTLLTLFMQYSRIRPLYAKRPGSHDSMRALYERLRWYSNVSDEPLFWLQFAILELNEGRLASAKQHLEFAYEEARKRPGFLTYQIDTQYLRLVLDAIETSSDVLGEDACEQFVAYVRLVGGMITEDSHRFFAYELLERLPKACRKIGPNLTEGERISLASALQFVSDLIDTTSPEFKARTGAETLRRDLTLELARLT
jgi:hypothetical protein